MNNTVLLGDCLELMNIIPNKSVDMILCDLPYGTTACKWDIILPFDILWAQYKRIIKPAGVIVLFGSQPFTTLLISSNLSMFKYELVWSKKMTSSFATAKYQPMKAHENILIFATGKTTYNPQMVARTESEMKRLCVKSRMKPLDTDHIGMKTEIQNSRLEKTHKYPQSVLNINGVMNNSPAKLKHPTQKPVALFEYLIKTFTNERDVVLDNCAGSGTTAIACLNSNRNYILMEKEQKYYDIINDRIGKHIVIQPTTTNKKFFNFE